ncbi:MAG: hypothetical protein FWF19_03715 [Euryarchaeota archaeon]|nr:hypothetical protein [Euryarchaeota archaeon]
MLELVIDAPPSTVITGMINEKKLTEIGVHTYTISVTEPGTLHIREHTPADDEKPPFERFARPNPVIIPPF